MLRTAPSKKSAVHVAASMQKSVRNTNLETPFQWNELRAGVIDLFWRRVQYFHIHCVLKFFGGKRSFVVGAKISIKFEEVFMWVLFWMLF
jgi:hypothetical protein